MARQGAFEEAEPGESDLVAAIPRTASEKPQERFLRADFAPDASNVHVEDR